MQSFAIDYCLYDLTSSGCFSCLGIIAAYVTLLSRKVICSNDLVAYLDGSFKTFARDPLQYFLPLPNGLHWIIICLTWFVLNIPFRKFKTNVRFDILRLFSLFRNNYSLCYLSWLRNWFVPLIPLIIGMTTLKHLQDVSCNVVFLFPIVFIES